MGLSRAGEKDAIKNRVATQHEKRGLSKRPLDLVLCSSVGAGKYSGNSVVLASRKTENAGSTYAHR